MSQRINIIGKTFGRWKVLSFAYSKKEIIYWNCKCVCGKKREVRGANLRTGQSKSCGCSLSDSKMGAKNPQWKENPLYRTLHHWVRRNKPKVTKCENCKEKKKLEVANVSGKYKRDVNDYQWLCRSCHMKSDGRFKNLKQYQNAKI